MTQVDKYEEYLKRMRKVLNHKGKLGLEVAVIKDSKGIVKILLQITPPRVWEQVAVKYWDRFFLLFLP